MCVCVCMSVCVCVLGMVRFDNIKRDSYKSLGMLNV